MNKDISIIIVNWNTRDLLINCIESIYKTIKNLSLEIWIVDNGSRDESVNAIRRKFPDVNIIENKENLGFAKANNQALRQMHGRYAVLLNTDTILTDGAIETIVHFMDKNADTGICGGQLLNADGTKQNSIANIPTLATELLNKSLLRRLFPEKYPGKERDLKSPVEVESVIGACMVVRKKAIDDAGLMDESYFFFLEETDWCLRMRKKGWKIFHHPEAKIYHLQGKTAKRENVKARIEYWRSRYIFFEKNYGLPALNLLKAGLILKLIMNLFLISMLNVVSLFTNEKAKDKFRLYIKLIAWHLKGLPLDWGLRSEETTVES